MVVKKIKEMIEKAREAGATPENLAELRQALLSTGYHPTRKVPTKAYRKAKRRQQKTSRKTNRRSHKGQKCTKGQHRGHQYRK